jgi:hypothetical protein
LKVQIRGGEAKPWRLLLTDELWFQVDFLFLFWDWQPGFSVELR